MYFRNLHECQFIPFTGHFIQNFETILSKISLFEFKISDMEKI